MNTQIQTETKDIYKTSRLLYIIEAAVEYFVTILVGGAYLATLTEAAGMSDALTGILSAFTSLGCAFQFVSIFLARKTPVKRWVIPTAIVSELMFALIYLTPFLPFTSENKSLFLIIFLLGAHVLTQIIYSPKMNWFMSLIPNGTRGVFTAKKEMVSLIGGMVFTWGMGSLVDMLEESGNKEGGFILCGATLLVLMLSHTLTLVFSREKPQEGTKTPLREVLPELIRDKKFVGVAIVPVIWAVANNVAIPFYGSYQIKELGFSLGTVALIAAICSISRAVASIPMGKLADRFSFTNMLCVCYGIQIVSFAVATFTVPQNGLVFYTIQSVLHYVAMAGINSGQVNLIYDFVDPSRRTAALAVKNTAAGVLGFLATFVVSFLITYIQTTGFSIFGQTVYAQQVVSAIGLVITVLLTLYLNVVVRRFKR